MNAPELPDYLRDRKSPATKDKIQSVGVSAPPYLSIQGGRFTLIDEAGNEQPVETTDKGAPYVDVIIIDALERISKIFYGGRAFDPGTPQPPVCFSDNGIAPSRNAGQPQSPTCPSCQWFPWGSAVSKVDPSKRTKACQDYQKLALMVPGTEGVYLLRVPPNSLKPLDRYKARFTGNSVDISDVVTRITFARGVLGTLEFKGVAFIDRDMAAKRETVLSSHATDTLVGRTDQPIAGPALTAAHPAPQLAQPHYEPAPLDIQRAPPTGDGTPTPNVEPPARKRGRPKLAQETPTQAPFPTASNPSGVQQAATPGGDLAKTMDDFFGGKQ